MRIELCGGKYATGINEKDQLFFERYNEPWPAMHDMTYSKFMRALVEEIGRLKELEHAVKLAVHRHEARAAYKGD